MREAGRKRRRLVLRLRVESEKVFLYLLPLFLALVYNGEFRYKQLIERGDEQEGHGRCAKESPYNDGC